MSTDNGISAYESLGADVNKAKMDGAKETVTGVVSQKLPELTLDMPNEDIAKLTEKWEKAWKESPKKADWEKQCKENEEYWLGKQFDTPKADKSRPMVDNIIFESVETYLPRATRRNPDPLVSLDATETPVGKPSDPAKVAYIEKVKARLADLADKNKFNLKLKKAARHWAIYLLGVAKFGWDLDNDMPIVRIVRPQKIILDPEATVDEDGYNGDRIGEYRKMTASKMLAIIGEDAEAQKVIKDLVKEELETEVQFIEWWTPQYMCWKVNKDIVYKKKNPHWNYDKTLAETSVDEYGNETPTETQQVGINHFATPRMPFEFLVVFNLGDQPMDKTSLIGQNLSSQDLINKRNKQIDKNADKMNGGAVVSLARSGLTQAQAKNVVDAVRKGGAVLIPDGAPQDAVYFPQVPALPADVFNQLVDVRQRVRDIFGTAGSTPAGVKQEDTVRGKIEISGLDTDRIGGGVSQYLEQFADASYNWFVQMLYVYDDGFQFINGAVPPKVVVSVKEGSLLPKDSIAIANQAIELGTNGKMALVDMYKRLEYPNPEELAANVWLEVNAPQLLYKDNPLVQEAIAQAQAAAQQAAATASADAGAVAEAEGAASDKKHDQSLEKEVLKSALKQTEGKGAPGRSILSEVPATS